MLASAHLIAMVAITILGVPMEQPLSSDWQIVGDGNWKALDNAPAVVWQGNGAATTSALVPGIQGTGNAWRCLVEPGVQAEKVGIWFNASADLKSGFLLTLGGTPGVGGIELRDAAGAVLWCDKYAPWVYYTPYIVEGVVEPGRVRVQMLGWNRTTLLAQSDWITVPDAQPGDGKAMALYSERSVARFSMVERADKPLMDIVPDSPTQMRLVSSDNSEWLIVGDGDWRWTSPEKNRIRQGAQMERSTAINKTLGGVEGTWRCRVNVDKGTCGAGMVIAADETLEHDFNVWLGGEFGAGGLMLYRNPGGQCLWSSPQDMWHYNTDYVLEGVIAAGKVSARMLAADGTTLLAESPAFDLTAEENGRSGFVGFMAWRGTAEFWDFSEGTRAAAAVASTPAAEGAATLSDGWKALSGTWKTSDVDGKKALEQSGAEPAIALNDQARAAKGVYRGCVVAQEGVQSLSLMFQVSADLQQGFECRLGQGAVLHSLDGRDLWKKDDFQWEKGKPYILEGVVVTDRVSIRVLDEAGTVLIQSDECYVSDKNNTREGVLGFRVEGGSAQLSDWSIQPRE